MNSSLKNILEQVHCTMSAEFLKNDPVSFPHTYPQKEDAEIAAFLSASLAYGRVAMIRRNLADLSRMPQGPAAFVRNFEPRRDKARLEGFKHRFNSAEDMACLCWMLHCMQEEQGSLEKFFLAGDSSSAKDIGAALASFCGRALNLDMSPVLGQKELPNPSTVRYFFPSPSGGSACKRLCMFLRWVCRPADGIDLGLWSKVSPRRLVIPLDTHTARISQLLGLTGRRSPGWKMALEVTESLRQLDPEDPVRFDFALAHLGISEGCTGRQGEICLDCPVKGQCVVARKP